MLYEKYKHQYERYITEINDNLILFLTKEDHEYLLEKMLEFKSHSIQELKKKFRLLVHDDLSLEDKIAKKEKELAVLKKQLKTKEGNKND